MIAGLGSTTPGWPPMILILTDSLLTSNTSQAVEPGRMALRRLIIFCC